MPQSTSDRQLLSRLFTRSVVLPLILMGLLTLLLIWQVYRLVMNQQWVERSDQVLNRTQQIGRLVSDEQTAMRNYLTSHDPRVLEPYRDASTQIDPAIDDLISLEQDDSTQSQRCQKLSTQLKHWEAVVANILQAPSGTVPTQQELAADLDEMNRADAMRLDLRSFIDAERNLHTQRASRTAASMHWVLITAGGLALVSILLAVASRRHLLRASVEFGEALDQAAAREKIIRDNEQIFRATFDNAPVGIAHFSIDGRFLMINERLTQIVGRSREKLLELKFRDITHPNDITATDEQFRKTLAGDLDHFGLEKRYIREDGTSVWVNKTVALLRHPDRSPNYFIAIIEDISAQKLFEQSLNDAKEQAESANRSKDQFLAVLSHELRTPLTPVLAITSALQEDQSLPEQFKGDMEMIRRNIEWEAHLIDDLLDLNAIAKRKIQFHSEVTDLHAVIDNVVRLCAAEMKSHKLQLKMQLEAASHHVQVDPRRFQQVIRNLLQNSIKFTDPGGSIMITSSNIADDRIRVEVVDTGMGMPADLIPRLFMPFEQGERTVTRKFGGLGLGLAISKALVEAHGGAISAASPGVGHGSTFAIELQTVVKPAPTPETAAPPSAAAPVKNNRRILLVEDHPDTLKTMARLLKTCKYEVETAATVAEAISQLQSGQFDLLISDLGLPDGRAYDVIRYVRAHRPMRAIALFRFRHARRHQKKPRSRVLRTHHQTDQLRQAAKGDQRSAVKIADFGFVNTLLHR